MSEINWETKESAEWYNQNCTHQFRKGEVLIDMLHIQEGGTILDLGCGTGQQALNVTGIIGSSGKITCIDPSSERIEIAKSKFQQNFDNIRFVVGQAEDLSCISDNSINHAYFCSSFHWVDDKQKALQEVMRVLKPGGNLGMTTPDKDIPGGMRPILDAVLEKYGISGVQNTRRLLKKVTSEELQALLHNAGFNDITIDRVVILKDENSRGDFKSRFEKGGRMDRILKEVPDDMKEKVKQDVLKELQSHEKSLSNREHQVSLFTIAAKPLN